MTEIENLKAALSKARDLIAANRLVLGEYSGVKEVMEVEKAIGTALTPPEFIIKWNSANGYYYAHKRELLAMVTPNGNEWDWRITLANGKREHNFRYGTTTTLEVAKLLAEAALKEVK
jgi:hypothetical protein